MTNASIRRNVDSRNREVVEPYVGILIAETLFMFSSVAKLARNEHVCCPSNKTRNHCQGKQMSYACVQ